MFHLFCVPGDKTDRRKTMDIQDKKINKSLVIRLLDKAYNRAINPAITLGDSYLQGKGDINDQVNQLIKYQVAKTSATGFITGMGGLVTLPVAIPADVAATIYVQTKMIAAIAHMGGYDIRDDKVKTLVYICLVGDAVKDVLTEMGVSIARRSLLRVSGESFSKLLPFVGGIIAGTINGITTKAMGEIARKTFIGEELVVSC
jgi:uncharacterized protein (DUF697 family)